MTDGQWELGAMERQQKREEWEEGGGSPFSLETGMGWSHWRQQGAWKMLS